MSISDNYVPIRQIGNGVTTVFSGNWKVLVASYIRVFLEDAATGVLTPQSLGSDFTLTFNDAGFQVTFAVPPPNTDYVVISRAVALDQTDPYRTSKGFQGKVIEDSFDKLTAITQDLSDESDRSLKFNVGSPFAGYGIQNPQDGYGLIWDVPNQRLRNTTAPLADLEDDAEIVADNIGDVIIVATDIANVNIVAANIADVNTVAGIAAAVSTTASISAQIVAVDANEANINAVAAELTDIGTVAASIADVNAVAANIGDVISVAANEVNIDAVAADLTNINIVATDITNVNTVAVNISDVNSVAGNMADVNDVADNLAFVITVANNMATITDAANNIPKANRTATTNPTVNDDAADGYSEGSLWINTTSDTGWICLDPANGAAVWNQITTGTSGLVKVSVNDTTAGYLNGKLSVPPNSGIGLTEENDGGNETLQIRVDATSLTDATTTMNPTTDGIVFYRSSGNATLRQAPAHFFKVVNAFTENTSPDLFSDMAYLYDQDQSGTNTAKKVKPCNLSVFGNSLFQVQDQKAQGTAGGAPTAATWNTRTLNTVVQNQISGASLSSNQITLPAGTYYINAKCCIMDCDEHKVKLRNITDGSDTLVGVNNYSNGATIYDATFGFMEGQFTIASQKVFEVQHYATSSRPTDGYGRAVGQGVERYSDVQIWRLK